MHLLIVQSVGDYREAVQNFARGKAELYYAQHYSIDSVAKLTHWFESVTVLCGKTAEAYNEVLDNGVRAIGTGQSKLDCKTIIRLMAEQQPTHLIVRIPSFEILTWAIRHRVKTMALFAESVQNLSWKSRIKNFLLVNRLNHPQIQWVASYGLNASLELEKLGVHPHKIIPWDFLWEPTPGHLAPRSLQPNHAPRTLFYIGSLRSDKGVDDIYDAIALLRTRSLPVRLKIAGLDGDGTYHRKAEQMGIADAIEFMGLVPNPQVEALMQTADVVVIPSHHRYPEGFPLTIHHALRARTPIIASDHPMFRNVLRDGYNSVIFPAGNATALSAAIERLFTDADLYFQLSDLSHATWNQMRLPVKWADLLEHWGNNAEKNQQWFSDHCLTSNLYQVQYS